MCGGCSITILSVIYRSPSESASHFMNDFDNFLEEVCTTNVNNLLVLGDFINIHMNDMNNSCTKQFVQILHQHDLSQFVHECTHIARNTIDLVFANESDNLIRDVSVHDNGISDHFLVLCKVNSVIKRGNDVIYRDVRDWCAMNFDTFASELSSSPICDVNVLSSIACVSTLSCMYNQTMASLVSCK